MLPPEAWSAAGQIGFSAILVLILLWKGGAALQRITDALDRNTRAITGLVLSMTWLPKPFHQEAEVIRAEIHDAESKRGK